MEEQKQSKLNELMKCYSNIVILISIKEKRVNSTED